MGHNVKQKADMSLLVISLNYVFVTVIILLLFYYKALTELYCAAAVVSDVIITLFKFLKDYIIICSATLGSVICLLSNLLLPVSLCVSQGRGGRRHRGRSGEGEPGECGLPLHCSD